MQGISGGCNPGPEDGKKDGCHFRKPGMRTIVQVQPEERKHQVRERS
jgi:hypothetical protein